MFELKQFCNEYLPQYFALKYNTCKLKSHFFDFKNQQNVYELTSKIFSLIDHLQSANSSLEAANIIQKYFIFNFSDFRKQFKDMKPQEQDGARQAVHKIMKKMHRINRQSFQIYIRLVYIYFDFKEQLQKSNKNSKTNDYIQEIQVLYMDLKLKTMTQDDSFSPMEFMQYIIRLQLSMNPNQKFLNYLRELIQKCDFTQNYEQKILNKVKEMEKKNEQLRKFKQVSNKKNPQEIRENTKQKVELNKQTDYSEQILNPQKTPIKDKSSSKQQRNTHETSQKKQNIIMKQQTSAKSLDTLKKSLKMHKNSSGSLNQRTLYLRKTYLVPKKGNNLNLDQISSTGSNNDGQLCLIQINRGFSSRCISFNDEQEEDFLVEATPKPKKKLKLEKTYTSTFDQNGNFIKSF